MKPSKTQQKGRSIYGILQHLHRFKQGSWDDEPAEICPVYSPPQKCVKGECVWYSITDRQCWVLHPKPFRDQSHKA